MLRTLTLACVAVAAVLPAFAAGAQYYDPYRRPPPPPYGYDRPQPRYDYDRPRYNDDDDYSPPPVYRSRRFGDMCVTSRGECSTRPGPIAAPCRCYIEGFGEKRGAIQ